MKSSLLLCALATVALLPISAQAETRAGAESTIKSLTTAADAVVVGTCIEKKAAVVGGKMIETTYEVQVGESLKGKRKAGSTFAFTVPGGELTTPPITMAVQAQPQLTKGEEVVLFLNEKPLTIAPEIARRRNPASNIGAGPRVVGMNRGKFTVIRDEATGQKRVARINLEDFGYAHQDLVYRSVLRNVATGDLKSVDGSVVELAPGVYTNPEGKALLDSVKSPAKPKPIAKSAQQVKAAAEKNGGVVVQDFDEFKAQILQFAN